MAHVSATNEIRRGSELNVEILFLLNNQSNVLNCITILQNFLTINVKGKNMR